MKWCSALPLMLLSVAAGAQVPQEPLVRDFETLDADGDGYVTRREAENQNIWFHFEAIDSNRDEALSRDEFTTYIAEEDPVLGEPQPLEEQPQAHLRERTQPGDQHAVTNPELLPKIATRFGALDGNGDRFIAREEASTNDAFHEHFTNMDADSDGRVSRTEYNNYLEQHGTQAATEDVMENYQREHE